MKYTTLAATAIGLAALLSTGAASAQPFEIYAKYEPTKDSTAKSPAPLSIVLADSDVIPRTTVDYLFDGIFVRAKKDDVSVMALANLTDFTFAVTCDSPKCHGEQNAGGALQGSISTETFDQPVLLPEHLPGADAVARLDVQIKAKFTRQYLCGAEIELRNSGAAIKDWDTTIAHDLLRGDPPKPAAKPSTAPSRDDDFVKHALPDQVAAAGLLAHQMGKTNSPIYASYCQQIDASVDWKALVGKGTNESVAAQTARADNERASQGHALSALVAAYLKTDRKIAKVVVDAPAGACAQGCIRNPANAVPDDIYISNHQAVAVIREPTEVFDFKEVDDLNVPLRIHDTHIVSQSATINIVHAHGFCDLLPKPCNVVGRTYFTASLEGPDPTNPTATTPTTVARDVALAYGTEGWSASVPLKDFLYKTVTLKLSYKLGGNTFLFRQETFTIENLGFVSTLPPVIADIASLIKRSGPSAANPNDPAYKSSIPISWAYNANAGDGRHVAITLPWMFGYNPRQAPKFSDYLKVFAHVSFVLPVTSAAINTTTVAPNATTNATNLNAQVAFGAGFQVVNAFSFAWGITTDHATNYLLLGISAPNLVNAFK